MYEFQSSMFLQREVLLAVMTKPKDSLIRTTAFTNTMNAYTVDEIQGSLHFHSDTDPTL